MITQMDDNDQNSSAPVFRYGSKAAYEAAIAEMIRKEYDEEEYESLLDEYLMFCSSIDDG